MKIIAIGLSILTILIASNIIQHPVRKDTAECIEASRKLPEQGLFK
jgi:hypothetical protein